MHPSGVLPVSGVNWLRCIGPTRNALVLDCLPSRGTVYQAAPPQSYTTKPYIGRGSSFNKGGSFYRRSGGDRDRSRSAPSSTVTQPSKSGDGLATMTVTLPQEPNKRQLQTPEGAPRSKRQCKSGKHKSNKKE